MIFMKSVTDGWIDIEPKQMGEKTLEVKNKCNYSKQVLIEKQDRVPGTRCRGPLAKMLAPTDGRTDTLSHRYVLPHLKTGEKKNNPGPVTQFFQSSIK